MNKLINELINYLINAPLNQVIKTGSLQRHLDQTEWFAQLTDAGLDMVGGVELRQDFQEILEKYFLRNNSVDSIKPSENKRV